MYETIQAIDDAIKRPVNHRILKYMKMDARIAPDRTATRKLPDSVVVTCHYAVFSSIRFWWSVDGVPVNESVAYDAIAKAAA